MLGARNCPSRSGDSARPLSDGGILHALRSASKRAPKSEGDPRRRRLSIHGVHDVGGLPTDDRRDVERGRARCSRAVAGL